MQNTFLLYRAQLTYIQIYFMKSLLFLIQLLLIQERKIKSNDTLINFEQAKL